MLRPPPQGDVVEQVAKREDAPVHDAQRHRLVPGHAPPPGPRASMSPSTEEPPAPSVPVPPCTPRAFGRSPATARGRDRVVLPDARQHQVLEECPDRRRPTIDRRRRRSPSGADRHHLLRSGATHALPWPPLGTVLQEGLAAGLPPPAPSASSASCKAEADAVRSPLPTLAPGTGIYARHGPSPGRAPAGPKAGWWIGTGSGPEACADAQYCQPWVELVKVNPLEGTLQLVWLPPETA